LSIFFKSWKFILANWLLIMQQIEKEKRLVGLDYIPNGLTKQN
jgi:hypothetical protein